MENSAVLPAHWAESRTDHPKEPSFPPQGASDKSRRMASGSARRTTRGMMRAWAGLACNVPGSIVVGLLECTGGDRNAGRLGRTFQAGGTEEAEVMRPLRKEQLGKVRTKIVATVGPASSDPAILRPMVEAGVD